MQRIIELAQSGAAMEDIADAIYEYAYIAAYESEGPNSCNFEDAAVHFEEKAWEVVEEIQKLRDWLKPCPDRRP